MPLRYKFDVLLALKNKGYSTYKLQKENILGSFTIQKIRRGEVLSAQHIATLCRLLECQPGDLLEYVPDQAGD